MEHLFTQKDLWEILDYNPHSGVFMWCKQRRGIKTGVVLGTDNGFGYLRISVLGKSYYAHRLAWFYVHGTWPDQIDHINGIKSDNRINNLRDVTVQQNNQNKLKAQKNSISKVLGVSWHKKANKWQAHICVYKERKYLGLFKSVEDAHKAYLKEKERIEYGKSS
jgi:HNH endonuclease/AP2 domain